MKKIILSLSVTVLMMVIMTGCVSVKTNVEETNLNAPVRQTPSQINNRNIKKQQLEQNDNYIPWWKK